MLRGIVKNLIPYGIVNRRIEKKQKSLSIGKVEEPVIYNSFNERMRVFYLQDSAAKFQYSFTAGRESRYIFWDRDNARLPIHFYTHEEIFNTLGVPTKKFAVILEPESMACFMDSFKKLLTSSISDDFVRVFTTSETLLNKLKNAELFLGMGCWYGCSSGGGAIDEKRCLKKLKLVSMVSSNKSLLPLHRRRLELVNHLKQMGNVDIYGSFNGGSNVKMNIALDDYMFNIAFESDWSAYYFSERILSCFASMTIPIYVGTDNIGKWFNIDGIIMADKDNLFDSIETIIKNKCTPEYYNERLEAIQDNFNRVQNYLSIDDYIYRTYHELF